MNETENLEMNLKSKKHLKDTHGKDMVTLQGSESIFHCVEKTMAKKGICFQSNLTRIKKKRGFPMACYRVRSLKAVLFLLFTMHISNLNAIDNCYAVDMEIDRTGNYAVAAWVRDNNVPTQIRASTGNTTTGVWTAPVTISNTTYESFAPIVAVNDSGDAVAIWAYYDSTNNNMAIASSVYPNGGAWSAPVMLSGATENVEVRGNAPGKFPYSVKISNTGELCAVWTSFMSSDRQTRSATGTALTWTVFPIQLSP